MLDVLAISFILQYFLVHRDEKSRMEKSYTKILHHTVTTWRTRYLNTDNDE